jgi:hypothetical protein
MTAINIKYSSTSALSSSILMLNHLTISALTYVKSARHTSIDNYQTMKK